MTILLCDEALVGYEGVLPLLRLGELLSNVFTHFLKVTVSLLGLKWEWKEREDSKSGLLERGRNQ